MNNLVSIVNDLTEWLIINHPVKRLPAFMESRSSYPTSLSPSIRPYSEPVELKVVGTINLFSHSYPITVLDLL